MRKTGIMALIFFLLFPGMGIGLAYTPPSVNSGQPHLNDLASKTLYGEITEIHQGSVSLHTVERDYVLSFTRDTRFYCNDSPAAWQALRPVYHNAFFEAYLIINGDGDLTDVQGYYFGKECKIDNWEKANDHLKLFLKTVEEEQELVCPLTPGARVPAGPEWLSPGEAVFVLFSIRGGIRAVYSI